MNIYFRHDDGFFLNGKIYCEVFCNPTTESKDELLEQGWLPQMEEKGVWYQSRSCRLNLQNFQISNKRLQILKKLKIEFSDYIKDDIVDEFYYQYYKKKNYNIFHLYQNCSQFDNLKVIKIFHNDNVVGISRICENKKSNIFLDLSYTDEFPKLSIGTNSFYILAEYTKKQNKKFLYIYESYKDFFNYKQNFDNIEIWDGRNWVIPSEKIN